MPTYDQNQIIFAHTTLADIGNGLEGLPSEIEATVKSELNSVFADPTVQSLIGEWELVWGPKVDISALPVVGDFRPINVLYIARQTGENPQYVVATSGTDSKSIFDWVVEDFWVNGTVTWPWLAAGNTTQPQISNGTNFGLSKLIAMTDAGQSARDYLQANATSQANTLVTVTGHSLGGALSPSYALYLNDTASEWNSSGNAKVACLAVAGPTPGDDVFANYYDEQLGPNTTRVWNEHDMVPHAWQKDMLAEIPTLYVPIVPVDLVVEAMIAFALYISRNTTYTQLLSSTPASSSTVVPMSGSSAFEQFMREACYQHVDEYITIFGMQEFQSAVASLLSSGNFFSCGITPEQINRLEAKVKAKAQSIPA